MSLDTATLATLREGYVPAACLPGVLEGWIGPAEYRFFPDVGQDGRHAWRPAMLLGRHHAREFDKLLSFALGVEMSARPDRYRLPLSRPECRLRVAAVLAAGERCAGGSLPHGRDACHCGPCDGDGWYRRRAPCWVLLPASEVGPGGLSPEQAQHAPELVACSVARALAGFGVVLLPPTYPWTPRNDSIAAGYAHFDATGLRCPWPEGA